MVSRILNLHHSQEHLQHQLITSSSSCQLSPPQPEIRGVMKWPLERSGVPTMV